MRKVKLKGRLRLFMAWPVVLGCVFAVAAVLAFMVSFRAGLIMLACLFLYIAAASVLMFYVRSDIVAEIVKFSTELSDVHRLFIKKADIPYALMDGEGRLLWANERLQDLLEDFSLMKPISDWIPSIRIKDMQERDSETVHFRYEDRHYIGQIARLDYEGKVSGSRILEIPQGAYPVFGMYLTDETEVVQIRKAIYSEKLVCGIILVDNYEEALNSTEEVRRALLSALVERKITKYLQNYDAIVDKLEKDRYMFVMRQKFLPSLQSSKFSILDDVRAINIGNEMNMTLSIGLGANGGSYTQSLEWAKHALDLALGRGGDQAVVKDGDKMTSYGGKTKQVEKSTRVRARVKAHALRQVIEGRDNVLIMGHQIGDADCFGAAVGIYRAAHILHKKANIVINEVTTSVRPLMQPFLNNPDYLDDMFITGEAAGTLVGPGTAVVVVDVNTAGRVEEPALLQKAHTVVVIDHHRQSGNYIENPVLSYIEPYASSACEMVTEILQYIADNVKLRPEEADALYSGIVIDTNNFLNETGVRTFEAAAFLRRSGADAGRVRLKLRDDMNTFKARSRAVGDAMIDGAYAYAVCDARGLRAPNVVGAQIANELLNIDGIEASFVFTQVEDVVFISARSLDSMNVQLVMERLGGGGHSTIAGAQLHDVTAQEAIAKVKAVVREMKTEGDI